MLWSNWGYSIGGVKLLAFVLQRFEGVQLRRGMSANCQDLRSISLLSSNLQVEDYPLGEFEESTSARY